MTVRTIASLAVVSALLLPVSLSATQAEQIVVNTAQRVAGLSISVDGQGYAFQFVSQGISFAADPKTLKLSYTAAGLTVDMTDGTLRISKPNDDGVLITTPHLFKSLRFSFSDGQMKSWLMGMY